VKKEKQLRIFRKRLRTYLLWCLLFFIINKVTSPSVNWFVFPILGWGIGIALQWLSLLSGKAGFNSYPKRRKSLFKGRETYEEELTLEPLPQKKWNDNDFV